MNKIAEIQISYITESTKKEKVTSCHKAYELLFNSWAPGSLELCEEFKIILLNRANNVLGIYPLSKGGVSGTVVDVKILFAVALKCNASAIIIAHNHPSGNLTPSDADIELTRKIKKCSSFLDIQLVDHLIISRDGFYSFATEGML